MDCAKIYNRIMTEDFTPDKLKAIIEVLAEHDNGPFAYATIRDRQDIAIEQIKQLEACIERSEDPMLCINYANNISKCTDIKRFISAALKYGADREYVMRYGEHGLIKSFISDSDWYSNLTEEKIGEARAELKTKEAQIDKTIRPVSGSEKESPIRKRKQRKRVKKSVVK